MSKRYKNIVFELAYTLLLLILFIFSDPAISTAGDLRITEYLMSNADVGFYFISPVLAWILKIFVNAFPYVNWWVVFSIFITFVGFWVFIHFIDKVISSKYGIIISSIFGILYWKAILQEDINFTQTAAIAAIAGAVIYFTSLIEIDNKKKILEIIIASIFTLISGAIRWKALVMCLPFVVMTILYHVLITAWKGTADNKRTKVKWSLSIMAIACVMVFESYGLHKIYGKINPLYIEYVVANSLREDIYDYQDRYPSWDEAQDEYEAVGIERSWIEMVNQSFTADRNHFSADDLRVMKSFRGSSVFSISDFFSSLEGYKVAFIIVAVLVLLIVLINGFRNSILPILGNVFGFIGFAVTLTIMGRYAWHVTVGIVLMAVLSLIYMSSIHLSEKIGCLSSERIDVWFAGIYGIVANVVVLGVAVAVIVNSVSFVVPAAKITNETEASLVEYMDSNDDVVYLDLGSLCYYDTHNIWSVRPLDYMDNVFTGIGHFILGRSDDLDRYEITDIVSAMINRSNIYTFYNDTWNAYLADYYDSCIAAGVVDEYGDAEFIRYVAPKAIIGEKSGLTVGNVHMSLTTSEKSSNYRYWNIAADIEGDLSAEEYYINVLDYGTGDMYSYPVSVEDGKLVGKELYINSSWSFMETGRYLVGIVDGECYVLADLSSEPVYEE